ncbi:hypothetical protein GCM10027269_32610 [Kribbella endophytica]
MGAQVAEHGGEVRGADVGVVRGVRGQGPSSSARSARGVVRLGQFYTLWRLRSCVNLFGY